MSDSDGPIPLRLLEEVVHRLGSLVPAEAATHFFKAQKELVLGVTALIEHNARQVSPAPKRGRRASSTSTTRTRRPRRVTID
ncbi:MAG: hypothetical protein WCB85_11945 [Candidatus Dormiibacterota bacterium]